MVARVASFLLGWLWVVASLWQVWGGVLSLWLVATLCSNSLCEVLTQLRSSHGGWSASS